MINNIEQYLKDDHMYEERKRIAPLGLYESVTIICDGIERRKNK